MPGTADVSGKSCVLEMFVGDDTWDEQRQLEEVAAVHRQRLHLGLGDGGGNLTARRFEHVGVGGHFHRGLDRANAQRDGQFERGAGSERQTAGRIVKAGELNREVVGPYSQIRKPESAVVVGDGRGNHIRFAVPDGDQSTGHDGARRVVDSSTDAGHVDGLLRGD